MVLSSWFKQRAGSSMISSIHTLVVASAFTLAGLACLCFGVWKLIFAGALELGLGSLGAGLALLFASMAGRFETFKIWGVEAKIRELNETVDKAEIALAQLKKLSELTSQGMIRLYSSLGRYAHAPDMDELESLASNVRTMLSQIGSSEIEIRKALYPWVRTAALVARKNILEDVFVPLENARQELLLRKSIAAPQELMTLAPRIEEIERYFATISEGILTCPAEEIAVRISGMVAAAPELSAMDRVRLVALADKAAKEVLYLATHYQLGDKAYWDALKHQ